MRILVEIVHPADVLFYRRPIGMFLDRGDSVHVVSRHKDVACDLLDGFGIPHVPVSTAGRGMVGLAGELLRRDIALWREIRRFSPNVMLGFGGVAISHAGRLTGVPSVVHYDSENATLQTRLAWPFVSSLTVPEDYTGPVPAKRTRRLPGTKELSYFHPDGFRPDAERARAAGLDPARRNVVVRLVEWRANHDIGKAGWTAEEAATLAAALGPGVRLHVSAEGALPEALAPYRYTAPPSEMHHLLAFSDALIGESATMACEAVTLGVPALYAGRDFPGYTLGLERAGLLTLLRPDEREGLIPAARALLEGRAAFRQRHADWLARCPDWATAVVAEADRMVAGPRGRDEPG